jgi:hypothetical protein
MRFTFGMPYVIRMWPCFKGGDVWQLDQRAHPLLYGCEGNSGQLNSNDYQVALEGVGPGFAVMYSKVPMAWLIN